MRHMASFEDQQAAWQMARAFTLALLESVVEDEAEKIRIGAAVNKPVAAITMRTPRSMSVSGESLTVRLHGHPMYELALGTVSNVVTTRTTAGTGTALEQSLVLPNAQYVMITPKGDCTNLDYMREILAVYKASQAGLPQGIRQAESFLDEIATDVAARKAGRLSREEDVTKVGRHEQILQESWEGILAYLCSSNPVLAKAMAGVGNCAYGYAMGIPTDYGLSDYTVTDGPDKQLRFPDPVNRLTHSVLVPIEGLDKQVAVYGLAQPAFERMKAAVEHAGVRG